MGADTVVPEYQPVVHRLRLSASPSLPTYPGRISLPQEPLGFRRRGFSPLSRYSCLHSHSIPLHRSLTGRLHCSIDAPLPLVHSYESIASALNLAPLHCPRRITRPVSYYALFQGWLLLSQPPGCLGNPTSFATEYRIWGLSWRSGLFPSRLRSLSPAVSLPRFGVSAFGVWLTSVSLWAP